MPVNIALGPSATFFQAGERLQLLIADWSLWQVNPLTGQFPAAYRKAPTTAAPCTFGPQRQAHLLIPVIP